VNTFRIFVSSTFTDLKPERDALHRFVLPRLRELCMRHGCRLQPIDLRWGVSDEEALDQQTLNICIEELRRCQRVTPWPNFVVLLGDRYGWRPLPSQIPADEMGLNERRVQPDELSLLQSWYRRDDNADPPEYSLLPRDRTGLYADPEIWAGIETRTGLLGLQQYGCCVDHLYHRSRTHLGLQKDTPETRPVQPSEAGRIISIPALGGLHHRYERRAA
jgi:hypothetical protein